MFLSAYEPIQACQFMEELFGLVKQGFWMITGLNFKWKHEHKQWRKGKQSEENSCSLLSHFWSTFWSPFFQYYIPFESLGSQESNASNRVWFGAEMRKIWPSEGNCIMLNDQLSRWISHCENFARRFSSWCEILPLLTMKKHLAKISQGGFRHLAKCLWNALFLHARATDFPNICSLIFSRVNSFCNLVFSRHKALSCNFAIYRGTQRLQNILGELGDRSSIH